jgi:hypothetical protein
MLTQRSMVIIAALIMTFIVFLSPKGAVVATEDESE